MYDNALYFPDDKMWETIDPKSAGWDTDRLDEVVRFAKECRSTGLVILSGGRILCERYWRLEEVEGSRYEMGLKGYNDTGAPIEDVASVQKSFVALMACIAREKGLLDFDESMSEYLGEGWTKATREQEGKITVKHVLSMSSGLDAGLNYEADPNGKWFYNNATYATLLHLVSKVANKDPHELTRTWLTESLGMTHTKWAERPWAKEMADVPKVGLATTARDLARFGLMVLAGGMWQDRVIVDGELLAEVLTACRTNTGYGYLWWLNSDKEKPIIPPAPNDMVACFGVGQKKLYVVPSLGLVVSRLGDRPDKTPDGQDFGYFNDGLWSRIMAAKL